MHSRRTRSSWHSRRRPGSRLATVWRQRDFPWLGIWEENRSRPGPPWDGQAVTRGMEFGVSPFPETRRQMIDRGRMFDVPTYRWIPARSDVATEYRVVMRDAERIPEALQSGGRGSAGSASTLATSNAVRYPRPIGWERSRPAVPPPQSPASRRAPNMTASRRSRWR